MNWKKFIPEVVQYRTTPRRVYFTQSEKAGRIVANFLFHRKDPGGDPVDFPVSIEIYTAQLDRVKEKPEIIAVRLRSGGTLAVKAAGEFTPVYKKLGWWARLRLRIAISLL